MGRYFRIVSTGFCFALFGAGGLILSFLVIPTVGVVTKDVKQRNLRVQNLIQISFRLFCNIMKYTGAMDYKITGAESITQGGKCLIVANHPSLIDYVLIASQLKQCDCLVKSSLWHNPFMKKIVQAAGYIPNRKADELIDICNDKFDEGHVLLIFPEGTRTTHGEEIKLQRGAAQIAVRTNTDIRLVKITVEPSFLTKETKWYQVPAKKPFFHVEVKGRIHVDPFIENSSSLSSAARQLSRHLEEVIQ